MRDLSGVRELGTPDVCQATEAALGGVQVATLLSSAVADAQDGPRCTAPPRPAPPPPPLPPPPPPLPPPPPPPPPPPLPPKPPPLPPPPPSPPPPPPPPLPPLPPPPPPPAPLLRLPLLVRRLSLGADAALSDSVPTSKVDKSKLTAGTRVALDMTTLTIMRALPREVDPLVYNMLHEDPGNVSYSAIGGLGDQIRELRESIELPLMNPELFLRVGIKPPKGVLLYGPPGTGKTLLARAIASNIDANFLKVVSSAIVDKYIGESARLIREMFNYARDHQPCIIFMDEIDAIGGRRFSEGTSADREIQRTLMELLNQLDGFDQLGRVKMIMATNRPDVLDPALLRPGRLDRKIEIPLPNEQGRIEVLKIHALGITKHGEIDYEAIVKLAEGFNGADLRNVCTEAGMFAIRDDRDYVVHEDFMKAVRKITDAKKLESSASYSADFGKD
ncbi:unnamed protein product [Closterium sp. NIES-54]